MIEPPGAPGGNDKKRGGNTVNGKASMLKVSVSHRYWIGHRSALHSASVEVEHDAGLGDPAARIASLTETLLEAVTASANRAALPSSSHSEGTAT